MPWWGWIVVGRRAARAPSCFVVPTDFFLVFLGVAAFAVGGVGFVGVELADLGPVGDSSPALAVVSLVVFRGWLQARAGRTSHRASTTRWSARSRVAARGARGRRERPDRAARRHLVGAQRGRRGARSRAIARASSASKGSRSTFVAVSLGGQMETLIPVLFIVVLAIIVIARTAIVVPQQSAYVVERLGKYSRTLQAGFHILMPVRRAHRLQALAEGGRAIDIPEQICITRDNVQVDVDGVLYLKVLERRARLLRHHRLRLRDLAARADDAALARSARSISTAPSRSAARSTARS